MKSKHFQSWTGSLEDWAMKYVPRYFSAKFCDFHKELIQTLLYSNKKNMVRLAPRGSGKSQIVGFLFPLFALCEQLHKCILIVSGERSLAQQWTSDIKYELESNEELKKRYGDLVPHGNESQQWRQDWIILNNGCNLISRGSIRGATRGVKGSGQRPTMVICDELETEENVNTQFQRQKLDRWFRRSLLNVGTPQTRYFVIGTPLHYDSLIWRLSSKEGGGFDKSWDKNTYVAILPNGKSYWPEMWSLKQLNDKREEIGESAFAQEYLCQPMSEEDLLFRKEYFSANVSVA